MGHHSELNEEKRVGLEVIEPDDVGYALGRKVANNLALLDAEARGVLLDGLQDLPKVVPVFGTALGVGPSLECYKLSIRPEPAFLSGLLGLCIL